MIGRRHGNGVPWLQATENAVRPSDCWLPWRQVLPEGSKGCLEEASGPSRTSARGTADMQRGNSKSPPPGDKRDGYSREAWSLRKAARSVLLLMFVTILTSTPVSVSRSVTARTLFASHSQHPRDGR